MTGNYGLKEVVGIKIASYQEFAWVKLKVLCKRSGKAGTK
jgi:hypothetical protein